MDRPNSSIRILVGMIILKEGQGWTFEEVNFKLQVRWALGLRNLDGVVLESSTYYDFKKALQIYQDSTNEDSYFRMDSKRYNTNIANSNLVS